MLKRFALAAIIAFSIMFAIGIDIIPSAQGQCTQWYPNGTYDQCLMRGDATCTTEGLCLVVDCSEWFRTTANAYNPALASRCISYSGVYNGPSRTSCGATIAWESQHYNSHCVDAVYCAPFDLPSNEVFVNTCCSAGACQDNPQFYCNYEY